MDISDALNVTPKDVPDTLPVKSGNVGRSKVQVIVLAGQGVFGLDEIHPKFPEIEIGSAGQSSTGIVFGN